MVRDLRVARAPVTAEDLAALQTDVLAGFVLARAAAGLSDGTIASDVLHLEQVRAWFGLPLWDMEPADADAYFGKVLRDTKTSDRHDRPSGNPRNHHKTGKGRIGEGSPGPGAIEVTETSGNSGVIFNTYD